MKFVSATMPLISLLAGVRAVANIIPINSGKNGASVGKSPSGAPYFRGFPRIFPTGLRPARFPLYSAILSQ
ncbi:hypothetical protein [Shimia aestuarii]|uniref:hypothetical protein n=1 Tax=Shimia aestuarii TaxID=254406 RepID=UPI0013F4F88F|nr:hypothetical protein [Shimia aestuarii]